MEWGVWFALGAPTQIGPFALLERSRLSSQDSIHGQRVAFGSKIEELDEETIRFVLGTRWTVIVA